MENCVLRILLFAAATMVWISQMASTQGKETSGWSLTFEPTFSRRPPETPTIASLLTTKPPLQQPTAIPALDDPSKRVTDEGTWTFDHFPADNVEKAYGVKINQTWLDQVQAASVRFTNSCSAALVSGDGLALSAHHCVASCVQALSTARNDYMRDGFLTDARAEERKCPGIQAE